MTAWMWAQRSLPLVPVLPGLVTLALVHVRARDSEAGLGSWSRLQLVAFVIASFFVAKVVTLVADYGIVAYGLGE